MSQLSSPRFEFGTFHWFQILGGRQDALDRTGKLSAGHPIELNLFTGVYTAYITFGYDQIVQGRQFQ